MDKKSPPQLFADAPTATNTRVAPTVTARAASRANPKRAQEPKFSNTSGFRDKPDGILNPVGEAGWFLERERVNRKLTLDDVAAVTGIHPYHLEAIEQGNMTRMPARLEALEMIAAYSDHLGFEPEPLLAHYASYLPAPHVAPHAHPADPQPLSSAKVLPFGKIVPRLKSFNVNAMKLPTMPSWPGGGIVAALTGFLALSGATFWMFSQGNVGPSAQVATVEQSDPMPTATTGPEAAEIKIVEKAIPNETLASVEPVPEDPDAIGNFIQQMDGDSQETATATPAPDAVEEPEIATPQLKVKKSKGKKQASLVPAGKTFGTENDASRITLTAKAPVWISVDDANGKPLMTKMLNAGDSYRVPTKEGLVVLTRDGGRVAFSIDGVEKGLLGTPGQIITGDPLSLEELQKRS